ncbi:hypothetical protein, partial [Methylogaea oryzae]|uniref:hypothetical protein n=1 Tax=Methylogaea oryzae TaxID=1295382 RepID=UPI0012E2A441
MNACRNRLTAPAVRHDTYSPGAKPTTRCTNKTKCSRGVQGQQSNGGALARGNAASNRRNKDLAVMEVTPSKDWALRRCRMMSAARSSQEIGNS